MPHAVPARRLGGGVMSCAQTMYLYMQLAALLATTTVAVAKTLAANKPNFIVFFVDVRV